MEGLAGFGGFGAFGGFGEFWRVCGLANGSFESLRKPLLWPGPGVPVGEVALALALGCLLGKWPWPWPWGACWGSGLGPGVPVGEGVWNFVLESLEPLRASKRQL